MRRLSVLTAVLACAAVPGLVEAQRVPFQRTLSVAAAVSLDVTTLRGTIEIVAGSPGRIVVDGAATVRSGWDVPAEAADIARRVAAAPPIAQEGTTVRLGVPEEGDARRAVVVSYRVQVPPNTPVKTVSQSGATRVRGTSAVVNVRTQSGAVVVEDLSGDVQVDTGSGAVTATDIRGTLEVGTKSGAFKGNTLRSSLTARTLSGSVTAAVEGSGEVTVETGSAAVRLALGKRSGYRVDASSRSGAIDLTGARVEGTRTKRAVQGVVGSGGSLVHVRTRSGSIRISTSR
jgi:hypothetical protein